MSNVSVNQAKNIKKYLLLSFILMCITACSGALLKINHSEYTTPVLITGLVFDGVFAVLLIMYLAKRKFN